MEEEGNRTKRQNENRKLSFLISLSYHSWPINVTCLHHTTYNIWTNKFFIFKAIHYHRFGWSIHSTVKDLTYDDTNVIHISIIQQIAQLSRYSSNDAHRKRTYTTILYECAKLWYMRSQGLLPPKKDSILPTYKISSSTDTLLPFFSQRIFCFRISRRPWYLVRTHPAVLPFSQLHHHFAFAFRIASTKQ